MEMLAYKTSQKYFGDATADIEKFQRVPADAPNDVVETSYFGFSIPEEGINAEIYHWYHPKLNMSHGGVCIYQGSKPLQTAAEYFDWRSFMPMPENTVDCLQASGVRVDMLEPNKRFRVRYEDAARETKFDFEATAIMPLPVRGNGGHFTQGMRTRGQLRLRGRDYKIDGYFTRDRSWGDPRPEKPLPIPAFVWNVGVFDDSLAFHSAAFDTPKYHPDWAKTFPAVKAGENHLWGYIWKHGRLIGIKSVDQRTEHGPDGLVPRGIQLRIEDAEGNVHEIKGTVISCCPLNPWDNMTTYFCLTRWECDGKVGYGDLQDCTWNDYVQAAFNNAKA